MSALDDRARKDQVTVNAIGTQADAVEKTATDGYPVNPAQIAQLKAAADTSGNPGRPGVGVARAEQISRYMESFRTLNPTNLQSTINELRDAGSPEDLLKGAEKLLKNMNEGIAADPVGWADKTRTVPSPPLDATTLLGQPGPNDMRDPADQMRDRVAAAETAARHYGITPQYLRPEERSAIAAVAAGGGAATVQMAKAIVNGFGDRAPLVMKELGKDPNRSPTPAGWTISSSRSMRQRVGVHDQSGTAKDRRRSRGPMRRAADFEAQNARVRDQYGRL